MSLDAISLSIDALSQYLRARGELPLLALVGLYVLCHLGRFGIKWLRASNVRLRKDFLENVNRLKDVLQATHGVFVMTMDPNCPRGFSRKTAQWLVESANSQRKLNVKELSAELVRRVRNHCQQLLLEPKEPISPVTQEYVARLLWTLLGAGPDNIPHTAVNCTLDACAAQNLGSPLLHMSRNIPAKQFVDTAQRLIRVFAEDIQEAAQTGASKLHPQKGKASNSITVTTASPAHHSGPVGGPFLSPTGDVATDLLATGGLVSQAANFVGNPTGGLTRREKRQARAKRAAERKRQEAIHAQTARTLRNGHPAPV